MSANRRWQDQVVEWIIAAVLLLLAASTMLPIINTLAISFSEKAAVSGGMVKLWPIGFNLFSYAYIIQDSSFWRAFLISIERVVLGGLLNFGVAVLTAFPLSRTTAFPDRNFFMWLLVVGMVLNVGLVPWYLTS